jgi:hypothetical protein
MILAESGNATFNSCHPGNVRWMPPEALGAGAGGEDEDENENDAKYEKPTKAWDVYSYGCVVLQVCRIVNTQNNLLTIVPDLLRKSALRLVNKCFICYGRDAEGTCAFQGHTESWSVSTALTVFE